MTPRGPSLGLSPGAGPHPAQPAGLADPGAGEQEG